MKHTARVIFTVLCAFVISLPTLAQPVAVSDTLTLSFGQDSREFNLQNDILHNDTHYGATFSIVRAPQHGQLIDDGLGNYEYIPDPRFWSLESDYFTYQLDDGTNQSDTTVYVLLQKLVVAHFDDYELDGQVEYVVQDEAFVTVDEDPNAAIVGSGGLMIDSEANAATGTGFVYYPIETIIGRQVDDPEGSPPNQQGTEGGVQGQSSRGDFGNAGDVGLEATLVGVGPDALPPYIRLHATSDASSVTFEGQIEDSNGVWHSTQPITVDTEHIQYKLRWWVGTGPEGDRSRLTLWINGLATPPIEVSRPYFAPQEVRLGVMQDSQQSSVFPAVIHFDDTIVFEPSNDPFESNRQPVELLVAEDFETLSGGDLGTWDGRVNNTFYRLPIDPITGYASAKFGTHSPNVYIYEDDALDAEDDLNLRFRFDPADLQMSLGETLTLVAFGNGNDPINNPRRLWARILYHNNGNHYFHFTFWTGAGPADNSTWTLLDMNQEHFVEMQYQTASSPNASDGFMRVWLNGQMNSYRPDLSNHDLPIDWMRLGPQHILSGTSGSIRYDDVMVWSEGSIYPNFTSLIGAPASP